MEFGHENIDRNGVCYSLWYSVGNIASLYTGYLVLVQKL